MFAIPSTSYIFVSVIVNDVKIHNEITYNVYYLFSKGKKNLMKEQPWIVEN